MQWANIIHAIIAVFYMAGSLGHIYMGTIGVKGSYAAMRTGYVDETWAHEHHLYWHEEIKQGKRHPREVSAKPATLSAQPSPHVGDV